MNRLTTFLAISTALLFVGCGDNPDLLQAGSLTSADSPFVIGSSSYDNARQAAADQYAWITMSWEGASRDAAVNLDLHVVDPTGVEVNLTHTTSSTARFLEQPECTAFDCKGDETNPSETIFWRLDNLPSGEYRAWVENISDGSSAFAIDINFPDQRLQESGSVSGGQRSGAFTWTVGAEPTGACLSQLRQLGVRYTPITISEGACTVKDAVMVSGPVNGITYRVDYARSTTRFRTSCEMAVALYKYGNAMKAQGITEVYHDGSYSCRNINGTSHLSTHSFARAMDFRGFGGNGQEYNVLRDWEKHTKSPSTAKDQVLHRLVASARGMFQVVLTPDDNSDHKDHFHMDIGR